MANNIPDLWPEDLNDVEVISPREILEGQAALLTERLNGFVNASVKSGIVGTKDEAREIHRFEISSKIGERRVKLFEISHRPDFSFPVRIYSDSRLPDFLRAERYEASLSENLATMSGLADVGIALSVPGRWVKNENVCATPGEFMQKLTKVLASTEVKSAIMAVLEFSHRTDIQHHVSNGPLQNKAVEDEVTNDGNAAG